MTLKKFISSLEENLSMELVFNFNGDRIKNDYHITEILKTSVSAIDCGGKLDDWKETVFQLIEPKNEVEQRFMSAQKAVKIYKKSSKQIVFAGESKVLLEFKPVGSSAAQRFDVSEIKIIEGKLIVFSSGTSTQCKALKRKSGSKTNSCCESASNSTESKCCA